jgi:serine/threonine protein kinase
MEVYFHKTNLNLVLEYLESDLEMIIKDKSILFMPGDVKHWMLMTMRGLDHCHRNWILHRVRGYTHSLIHRSLCLVSIVFLCYSNHID